MSPLEFPVRRYQFTLVAFLCLIALGWFAFANVPREEDPQFRIPGFFITAIYPGADPRDLEQLVAKPIEDKLAELDDVKKDASIPDADKKQLVTELEDAIKTTPPLEHKENVDVVKKHRDAIEKAMQ